jgi:hypothetical protein
VISEIDLREWRGATRLRQAFAQEGFQLHEICAAAASAICDGAFSKEEYLAESDAEAYFDIRKVIEREALDWALAPCALKEHFFQSRRKIGADARHQKLFGPMEEQKLREMQHIKVRARSPVLKRSEMRTYAEMVGAHFGFTRMKKIPNSYATMSKVMPASGLVGFFGVDTGGLPRRSPNSPAYLNTGFFISRDVPSFRGMQMVPERLVRGLSFYEVFEGAINPYGPDRAMLDELTPEFWSGIVEVGIYALVRFFDLFLQEADQTLAVKS